MRKSPVCVCIFIMAFMLVLCVSSPKATAGGDKPEKPLTTGSFDLNGKWKVTSNWKHEFADGTSLFQYEIAQKGIKINMITESGTSIPGTLKGNVIHLEPAVLTNPNSDVKTIVPDREYKISQDGNTLTSEFDYNWESRFSKGRGSMTVIMIRE